MQAMNRGRRIRHLEKSLPKEVCTAVMLNGDLRRIRKNALGLKMFEHLPRKLRLKNNRNVNVFCDAAFWEEGLVRLLYPLPPAVAAGDSFSIYDPVRNIQSICRDLSPNVPPSQAEYMPHLAVRLSGDHNGEAVNRSQPLPAEQVACLREYTL